VISSAAGCSPTRLGSLDPVRRRPAEHWPTGGQRDELAETRADAIVAGVQTAAAYAEHFEAQMDRGPRASCCPACCGCSAGRGVLLALILVTYGLLGYAAATVHLAPVVPAGAGQPAALPGAAAADGSCGWPASGTPGGSHGCDPVPGPRR